MRSYIDPRQLSFMNSVKVQIWCFCHYLCFVKSLPLLWFCRGYCVESMFPRFCLILSKLELRKEDNLWMIKMMSFERFLEERNRAFVPCCSFNWPEIMKSRRLGEKYIDNLWEVVKYKKKIRPPTFVRLLRNSKLSTTQLFFYYADLYKIWLYKKERKKEKKINLLHCYVKKQDP